MCLRAFLLFASAWSANAQNATNTTEADATTAAQPGLPLEMTRTTTASPLTSLQPGLPLAVTGTPEALTSTTCQEGQHVRTTPMGNETCFCELLGRSSSTWILLPQTTSKRAGESWRYSGRKTQSSAELTTSCTENWTPPVERQQRTQKPSHLLMKLGDGFVHAWLTYST